LVAGHYQPLADNPGVAPESDQTCPLQSDQRTLQSRSSPCGLTGFALFSPKGSSAADGDDFASRNCPCAGGRL